MPLETLEKPTYTSSMAKQGRKERPRPERQVPGLMTVQEAAEQKNVSTTAVYSAIEEGKLHAQRVGKIRVLADWEVEAWEPRPRRVGTLDQLPASD